MLKPVLCLCLIFGASVQKAAAQNTFIDSIINPTSLKQVVEVLASDSLQGRYTGTVHTKKAALIIADEFKKAGALPLSGNDDYFIPFTAGAGSVITDFNVIAALKGNTRPEELIIFSAHYDHIGSYSNSIYTTFKMKDPNRTGDTIYNGANDNASGVSAVIHLARYFGQLKNNERSIIFIAFSGEELGLLGSKQTVSLFHAGDVKAVINIEMIGRNIGRRSNAYVTGPDLSDLRQLLNKKLAETNKQLYGKKFFYRDPFYDEKLFSRSDNYWFAMKGIPSHTIMASSPDDIYYHSADDEPSTLDFTLMSKLVKAIALSCTSLIEGSATPARIYPGKISD